MIITPEYELYHDSLIIPHQARGWGDEVITINKTTTRPVWMTDAQWQTYALTIVKRELEAQH